MKMTTAPKLLAVAGLCVVAAGLCGCGNKAEEETSSAPPTVPPGQSAPTAAPATGTGGAGPGAAQKSTF